MLLFKYVLTSNVALTHTPSPSLLKLFFKFKPFFYICGLLQRFSYRSERWGLFKSEPEWIKICIFKQQKEEEEVVFGISNFPPIFDWFFIAVFWLLLDSRMHSIKFLKKSTQKTSKRCRRPNVVFQTSSFYTRETFYNFVAIFIKFASFNGNPILAKHKILCPSQCLNVWNQI